MKISIVIINDNESPYLKNFFESIDGSLKRYLDFIFVDNCSSDNSIEIARKNGIDKVIPFDRKVRSIATMYNSGLEEAKGEYILFVHSDVVFSKGFFEYLLSRLAIVPSDIMNFQVYYVDKITRVDTAIFWDMYKGEMYNMQLWGEIPDGAFYKLVSCSECCFLVKTGLMKAEKFNENYRNNFFIHEFMLRQISSASTNFYESELSVEHYFIERHKQLKTNREDEKTFLRNNLSVLRSPGFRNFVKDSKQALQQISNTMRKVQNVLPLIEEVIGRLKKEDISPELSVEIGEVFFNLEQYENAKLFFEKALYIDPQNSNALNNVGVLSFQAGDYKTAKEYFARALKVNPNNRDAMVNLALLDKEIFTDKTVTHGKN
jgi:glycosyltransferase involved in cell wall biosynthesis